MWDSATGSVWSSLDGRALDGPLIGEQLRVLPLQTTTWGEWLREHPETTVPAMDPTVFYQRLECAPDCPRSLGRGGLNRTFRDTLSSIDERLPENELVIGLLAGDEAIAFPIDRRPADAPLQSTVGGVPVVILEDGAGMPSLAYHRALSDGRVLDFERRDRAIYDLQTGSRWNASGLSVEGELEGVQLAFVTSFLTEWYGWAAFHPETTIYEAGS
jgi:hypothetical protein